MSEQKEGLTVGIIDEPNDGESDDDKLGIQRHATALTKFIKYTSTPMTIGIQGEWGSGKTSLLNSINYSLGQEGEKKKFKQIWINSWEHSLLSTPEEALLKIMNEIIHEMISSDVITERKDKIKRFSSNLIRGALRVGATAVAGGKAGDVAKELLGESVNTIKELRKQLVELAKEIPNSDGNPYEKIIIYVDDLDRIDPPDAVRVLELLKNIFSIPNCIFVLAIDYQVIVKGLKDKFGERTDENEWEFRAFFHKIIQLPFMMPLGQYSIGTYVNDLLHQIRFIDKEDALEEQIEKIILYTIGGNPRSLKRLVNSLALINIFAEEDEEDQKLKDVDQELKDVEDLSLFSIVCLQISFPKVYDVLVQNPDYKKWDDDIAFKVTEKKEEKEKDKFDEEFRIVKGTKEFDDPWEQALFRICFTSPRYRSRVTDISKFLNYLDKEILSTLDKKQDQGDFIAEIINKTTVTSVTATDDTQNQPQIPYQKTVFKDFDGMIKHLYEKNKISEKTKEILRYIDNFLRSKKAKNITFGYSPTNYSIKKDGRNHLVIKSKKTFVDIYHSGDEEDVKYLENYGMEIKLDKSWNNYFVRFKELSEFKQCEDAIVDYMNS